MKIKSNTTNNDLPWRFGLYIGGLRQKRWNQDEGSYTLGHTYDRFLATSHHYRGKNRKKN